MGTKLAQTKERTGSVEPTPATPPHSLVVESRKSSKEALQASPQLISQVLSPGEFTDENCGEIADFFRQIFNNDWADYAVCPPCDSTLPDGMRLSAKEVYGTDGHVPMEM
ncbi:MAG: hypothetical protein OEY44_04290, partial [Candidatus Peregrinibacteria bacterium]|nr:hypothetical protein [Candidatus Peregrinibacteria bacterium]